MSVSHAVVRTGSTRQHILDTARHVFASQGFGKTSLDQIATEAGVSKMTIFYHFKNKEELVVAALEESHAECMNGVQGEAVNREKDTKQLIGAIFEVLEERLSRHELNDIYMRAVAEFGKDDSQIGEAIHRHFEDIEETLKSLVAVSGNGDPEVVVPQLMLILMGLYATHLASIGAGPRVPARKMVESVMKASPAFAA
ncbi:MAG: TetR/AcrR family transcriptional regulator [Armatimonadota bacterium]